MQNIRNQRGSMLIEIIIGVSILAILSSGMVDGFAGALRFNARVETKTRLDAWRSSLEKFYYDNASVIDTDTAAQLNLGGTPAVIITTYGPDATTHKCTIDSTKITEIANRAGYAASDFVKDGGHAGFCLLITPRLSQTLNGATLYYHSIAVVSPGSDGVIDAGTSLTNTGELVLAAGTDDTGILFDGRKFSADKYNITMQNMTHVVQALDAYYVARYQADPNRSLSTDYFSCGQVSCPATAQPRWDQQALFPATCAGAIGINTLTGAVVPSNHLGLSMSDGVDGWGKELMIDNCTNSVRSPSNTSTIKQLPPYTSVISTTLPGGSVVSMTSVGQV